MDKERRYSLSDMIWHLNRVHFLLERGAQYEAHRGVALVLEIKETQAEGYYQSHLRYALQSDLAVHVAVDSLFRANDKAQRPKVPTWAWNRYDGFTWRLYLWELQGANYNPSKTLSRFDERLVDIVDELGDTFHEHSGLFSLELLTEAAAYNCMRPGMPLRKIWDENESPSGYWEPLIAAFEERTK